MNTCVSVEIKVLKRIRKLIREMEYRVYRGPLYCSDCHSRFLKPHGKNCRMTQILDTLDTLLL